MDTGTHRRRVKDVCTIVAMSLVVGLFAMPAAAQQEASIIGVVTDPGGAVLPGVSISARSPALQVPEVTTVTRPFWFAPPLVAARAAVRVPKIRSVALSLSSETPTSPSPSESPPLPGETSVVPGAPLPELFPSTRTG